jgi:integrase
MSIGSIWTITLKDVCNLARELGVALQKGVDPLHQRRKLIAEAAEKAQEEARLTKVSNKAEAVNVFLDANAPSWKHVHARNNWLGPLTNYAFPVIGQLRINSVKTRHILEVLDNCDAAGRALSFTRKVRAHLSEVFDWLIARDLRDKALGNPAETKLVAAGRPKPKKHVVRHYPRPELDDAPAVFRQLHEKSADNVLLAAWCFMALTAARPSEALATRWDQINLVKRVWVNPVPKTGKPLNVPLSKTALAILTEARKRTSSPDGLVFFNSEGKQFHVNVLTDAIKRTKLGAGSPHGWRSVFRDWAGDIGGVQEETAKFAIGHTLGKTEGAYRRETSVATRAVVMQRYEDWLLNATEEKVVAFPYARQA